MSEIITEEYINEGIIPMDFKWRAGIGKEIPDTSNSFMRNNYNQQNFQKAQPIFNKNEFYLSLIGEINLAIENLAKSYINRDLSETDLIILKNSIRNKINERFGGYKKYLDLDFINYLNSCLDENQEYINIIGKDYLLDCFSGLVSNKQNFNNDFMINS